jgi:hypothetical protein
MIWRASVWMHGLPVRGSDRILDGQGAMRWKLFGIFPVLNASGPDITRSAAGRLGIESIWLPSALCGNHVLWTERDAGHPHARFPVHGETAEVDFVIDQAGRVKAASMPRWGNPDGAGFRYISFGGLAEEEGAFGGYTVPTRMRAGWHFGAERFQSEGEFFRVTIDDAVYR